jgi:hypothetical protein
MKGVLGFTGKEICALSHQHASYIIFISAKNPLRFHEYGHGIFDKKLPVLPDGKGVS